MSARYRRSLSRRGQQVLRARGGFHDKRKYSRKIKHK